MVAFAVAGGGGAVGSDQEGGDGDGLEKGVGADAALRLAFHLQLPSSPSMIDLLPCFVNLISEIYIWFVMEKMGTGDYLIFCIIQLIKCLR